MLGKTLFLVYLVQGKNFRFRAYVVVSCVEVFIRAARVVIVR